jgi:hypothetical protein
MRTSTAFYAGVGTVVVAIIAGLGGGLFVGKITSPPRPAQGTKLEQPKLEQPAPSRVIAPAAASPQPQDIFKQPDVPQQASAPPSAYAAQEESKTRDANAKARDADLNRAIVKPTAERHRQQRAERRFQPRDDEPRRNKQARNAGPRMREGARDPTDPRNFLERPVGIEMPGISVSSSDSNEQ